MHAWKKRREDCKEVWEQISNFLDDEIEPGYEW